MGIHHPPDHDRDHRRPPHEARPVHEAGIEIAPRDCRQAEYRDHDERETRSQCPHDRRELPQVPRPSAEAVPNGISPNGDGDGERHEGGDGGDGEDRTDGDGSGEDEERQTDADDGVEPDGVDRCLGMLVDPLPDAAEGEAVITSIGIGDSRSGDHTSLAHGETADDGQAEDGKSNLLRHDLNQI